MFELVVAGGWVMVPIMLCSILSLAICAERSWTLRRSQVVPKHLLAQVWSAVRNNQMDARRLKEVRTSSPLGQILVAGLSNARRGREAMKESIEETGSHVTHNLEKYLNTLGTIAAISPLLGLLGTVFGMIQMFSAFRMEGGENAQMLAAGIAKALITTAAGLTVAIPTLVCHRHFMRRVDELVVEMEQEAIKLVDVLGADRPERAENRGAPAETARSSRK